MSNQGAPAQHWSEDDWWHTVYAGPAGTLPDTPAGGTGEGSVDDWFDSAVTLIGSGSGAPASDPAPESDPVPTSDPARVAAPAEAVAPGAAGDGEPEPSADPVAVADPAPPADPVAVDEPTVDDWFDSALGVFAAPSPESLRASAPVPEPTGPEPAPVPAAPVVAAPPAVPEPVPSPAPATATAPIPAPPAEAGPPRAPSPPRVPPPPPLSERRGPRPEALRPEPGPDGEDRTGQPEQVQQAELPRRPRWPATPTQWPRPRTGPRLDPRIAGPAAPAPEGAAPAVPAVPADPAPADTAASAAPAVAVPSSAPLPAVPPQPSPRRAPVSAPVPFVGERPPTYGPEPTALPAAEPDGLAAVVPDTVVDGAQYGSAILRAVSVRGDSARFRGEPRRDALLVTRFGEGADGLLLAVVAAPGRGEEAPNGAAAAAEAARQLAAAIGRSRSELAADLRAGARDRLRYGLQRLTARAGAALRPAGGAAEPPTGGADPDGVEGDSGSLHCLMVSLDAEAGHRAAFGTGPGGLYLLRSGHWIDAYAARLLHHPEGEPPVAAVPAEAPRPFRFRLVPATPGDILLLCTPGLAGPIADEPAVARFLSGHWAHPHPPGTVDFLRQVQVRAKGYADDRTAAALWTE